MTQSYWEKQVFAARADWTVIGAGFTGCFIALALRRRFPQARIQILERSGLAHGASTKNAGFICIASPSELSANAQSVGWDRMYDLLERRWKGRLLLSSLLDDLGLDVRWTGGVEVFRPNEADLYKQIGQELKQMNTALKSITGLTDFFCDRTGKASQSTWSQDFNEIHIKGEGQIQPARLLLGLHKILWRDGIRILYQQEIRSMEQRQGSWTLDTQSGSVFLSDRVVVATNGFSHKILQKPKVNPVRNQVIVTEKLKHSLQTTVHMDRGYYYLRPVGKRLLIGGGRHRLGEAEKTDEIAITQRGKEHLLEIYQSLFGGSMPQVDFHWSGILGIAESIEPRVTQIEDDLYAAVGLGGMGIAINMQLAEELMDII